MTNPIFGYDNGPFDDAPTVTASSDPATAPKENSFDWRLEDFWQPAAATQNWLEFDFTTARAADYLGFYSPDFYTLAGAQLVLSYGATTNPGADALTQSITTPGPKLFTFASQSAQFWRLKLNTTGAESPRVVVIAIGTRLELERGLRPGFRAPALASSKRTVTNISESGFFLGRSLAATPIHFSINTTTLTPAWVRSNWLALRDHLERYPFFCLPEPDAYPDEAMIAWSRGEIRAPEYSHSNFMSLALDLAAFR